MPRFDPNKWLNLTIILGLLAIALAVLVRGGGGNLPDIIAGGLLGYLAREAKGAAPLGRAPADGH